MSENNNQCPYKSYSVDLIRKLRGTDEDDLLTNSPRLSLTKIQLLTGAPWTFIKQAIDNPKSIVSGKCRCRHCPDNELTQDQVNYLCNDEILNSWRVFSLR